MAVKHRTNPIIVHAHFLPSTRWILHNLQPARNATDMMMHVIVDFTNLIQVCDQDESKACWIYQVASSPLKSDLIQLTSSLWIKSIGYPLASSLTVDNLLVFNRIFVINQAIGAHTDIRLMTSRQQQASCHGFFADLCVSVGGGELAMINLITKSKTNY